MNNNLKYTKPPWRAVKNEANYFDIKCSEKEGGICIHEYGPSVGSAHANGLYPHTKNTGTLKQNALLMAESPLMYEALVKLNTMAKESGIGYSGWREAVKDECEKIITSLESKGFFSE